MAGAGLIAAIEAEVELQQLVVFLWPHHHVTLTIEVGCLELEVSAAVGQVHVFIYHRVGRVVAVGHIGCPKVHAIDAADDFLLALTDGSFEEQGALKRVNQFERLSAAHEWQIVALPALNHHQQVGSTAMLFVIGLHVVLCILNIAFQV